MLQKLNLGSALAALVIFFLPWVDLQCSEKSLATQTGVQIIYGGGTLSEDFEGMSNSDDASASSKSDNDAGLAPLVALAFIAVVAAVFFASKALFKGDPLAEKAATIFPAIALGLLIIQLMVGFPIKDKMQESMSEGSTETQSEDEFAASMAAAMMTNFRVKLTPAFYLELIALGLPTLLLINAFIDKQRQTIQ